MLPDWWPRREPRGLIGERYKWCENGRQCHGKDLHIVHQSPICTCNNQLQPHAPLKGVCPSGK